MASRGLGVTEYAPKEVKKQAVVGSGSGDKKQVQHMVGILLSLPGALQADAADALAIALTTRTRASSLERIGIPRTAWGWGGDDRAAPGGTLVAKQPPWLIIDVNGVGYELEAPMSTFFDCPNSARGQPLHALCGQGGHRGAVRLPA